MRFLRGTLAVAAIASLWAGAYQAGARSGRKPPPPASLALPDEMPSLPLPDALGAWLALAVQNRAPRDPVRVVVPSFPERPRLAGPVAEPGFLGRAGNAFFRKRLSEREASPK